ncbi:MAG: succinylglutamate desuccinylase [Glaciecola sp.]|nr:succinylglutamate desuccinylase [Glaciecola sp.]
MPSFANQRSHFLHCSRTAPEQFSQVQEWVLPNKTRVVVHTAGIIEFIPNEYQPGKGSHVLYSCGVHGNETAPIEICDELVEALLAQTLSLTVRLMVQFANLPAMDIAQRFISENMNRLFCGAHAPQDNAERVRANQLEQLTSAFFAQADDLAICYHYDLHTAIKDSAYPRFAVYPFLHGKAYSKTQLLWLAKAGIQAVLFSESPTTTYSYFSSLHCGVHSFTLELGKVKPFGQNNMDDFAQARTALFDLVSVETIESIERAKCVSTMPVLFRIKQIILRHTEDFKFHFPDNTPNFTAFNQGDVLASEYDAQGTLLRSYSCVQDAEAIVFPNANVALGQRALLTVVPVSEKECQFDV